MTKKEVELVYQYIIRNHDRLQQEVQQLTTNIRYRSVDVLDCVELSLAIERYNTFCVVTRDIRHLLNLSKCKFEEESEKKMEQD